MIKLPKERRGFFCTKCHSSECVEGTIEQQHPPCAKCGYLGFAQDQGYDLLQLKQAVRDTLELAFQVAGPEDSYQDERFKAKADSAMRIRALIKEIE